MVNANFNLKIYYQNVRGLRTKAEEFYIAILSQNYDLILVTETWLNETVFDRELFDQRYNVFRRDRSYTLISKSKKDGGGVAVAVLKKYEVLRKPRWESEYEDLWITLKFGTNSLNICLAYLPPPLCFNSMSSFLNNVTRVISHIPSGATNLLVGDFNLSGITWTKDVNTNVITPSKSQSVICNLFLDNMAYNNLTQCNVEVNEHGNILDLIFSNKMHNLTVSKLQQPLLPIDLHHPALIVKLNFSSKQFIKPKKDPSYNFSRCDYDSVNIELQNTHWEHFEREDLSVNEMVNIFYETISPLIRKFTPKQKPPDNHYPSWFSLSLIKMLKEKAKYHSRFKKYGNPLDKLTFNILRDRCNSVIKECYNKFKVNAADSLRKSPQHFWRYLNSTKSNDSTIPNEMFLGDNHAVGGQQVCELFANYFQSVYDQVEPSSSLPSGLESACTGVPFSSCVLQESEVLDALEALDVSKGPGPDTVPPIFLKNCAKYIYKPLTAIYNKSLSTGEFPSKWKRSHITPIHKTGELQNIAQYRPISILSTCGKIFESLVYKKMLVFVNKHLNVNQHGFLPHKSTATNLVEYICDISKAVDYNNEVHAIYLDFKKAFDLVNHDILIKKIASFGIHGSLLRWCESYIRNRSQLVSLKGFNSNVMQVPSGVPQGSHIGPLFFVMFINDIGNYISSNYKLFADDLKLYRVVVADTDVADLQGDVNAVLNWCVMNRMQLNVDKCLFIRFTRKKNQSSCFYTLNGQVVKEVRSVRDLGVIIDSELCFRDHYDHIINKSSRLSGFITRQLKIFNDSFLTIYVYNSLARGILEYNSVVWNPGYQIHSDRIERVQKRFVYCLSYHDNKCKQLMSYKERLDYFKMQSLQSRRKIADSVFLYKILHQHVESSSLLEKIAFKIPRPMSRLHNRKPLCLPQVKTRLGQHSPIYRISSIINSCASRVDIFGSSLSSIKKCFKSIFS